MVTDDQDIGSGAIVNEDETGVRRIIEQFAEGIRTLNANLVSTVFHPEASSFSLTARGTCIEPVKAWPKIMRQARIDDVHLFRGRFSVRPLRIDIVGTVASAKVEWAFESCRIVDFYNLLKTKSGWIITNQVYHTSSQREQD